MANFETTLSDLAGLVWGPPLLILLFGTHIFLSFRLRFIQRYIFDAIKISLERKKEGEGDISQFGALTTALAATSARGTSSVWQRPSPPAAPAPSCGCG